MPKRIFFFKRNRILFYNLLIMCFLKYLSPLPDHIMNVGNYYANKINIFSSRTDLDQQSASFSFTYKSPISIVLGISCLIVASFFRRSQYHFFFSICSHFGWLLVLGFLRFIMVTERLNGLSLFLL